MGAAGNFGRAASRKSIQPGSGNIIQLGFLTTCCSAEDCLSGSSSSTAHFSMAPSKRVADPAKEQSRKKTRTSAGHPEGIKGELPHELVQLYQQTY